MGCAGQQALSLASTHVLEGILVFWGIFSPKMVAPGAIRRVSTPLGLVTSYSRTPPAPTVEGHQLQGTSRVREKMRWRISHSESDHGAWFPTLLPR